MKLKTISVLLMSSVLTACATSGYKVAPEKETASLRVLSTDSANTSVWIDNTEGCIKHNFIPGGEIAVLGMKANLLANRQAGRKIGMPLYRSDVHEKQQTELLIMQQVNQS